MYLKLNMCLRAFLAVGLTTDTLLFSVIRKNPQILMLIFIFL